jgi:hypothetical protein
MMYSTMILNLFKIRQDIFRLQKRIKDFTLYIAYNLTERDLISKF